MQKSKTLTVLLILLLLSGMLLIFGIHQAKSSSCLDTGLSGYITSQFYADQLIQTAKQDNITMIRLTYSAPWYGDDYNPYNASQIQYFLANSNLEIIVDVNHPSPADLDPGDIASKWPTIENCLFDVLQSFPNNSRIYVELFNEYLGSDFYTRMQGLINDIRNANYTNPLVVDKTGQTWSSLSDVLDNTYQGEHFYFDQNSLSNALDDMDTALGLGLKIINTEIGADSREYPYFTQPEVNDVNSFLNTTFNEGISNCIWYRKNLEDCPTYEQLGLKIPSENYVESSANVAVTNIIPYKTCVAQGTPLSLDVTIENQGSTPVSTDLTLETTYTYNPIIRSFTLVASAQGWNYSIPGPAITAYFGDTIIMQLQTSDVTPHLFYVDYDENVSPDSSEPQSVIFVNSTTLEFTADTIGNFTYYDAYNQNTMFGQISVIQVPHLQLLSSRNILLESGQERNVTFTFNTSQFLLGYYWFNASATTSGKTDTRDNSLKGGNVTLTILGDVNGDFKVDLEDLAIVSRCLGSTPGSSNWNPNADIVEDGSVTMRDIAIVARQFRQHYP